MIHINTLCSISVTPAHFAKLADELDAHEIEYEAKINRKNKKMYDCLVSKKDLTIVLRTLAKVRSEESNKL